MEPNFLRFLPTNIYKENKMVLIIHHNDLDGWVAAKIIEEQESKKEKVLLLPFDYGDEVPDTTKYSLVYILDLPLNAFPNLPLENVIHIDHHSGPVSSKTILCKSSVAKFCWEWFHSTKNPHIEAIDDFDMNGPSGNSMAYGMGTNHFGWNKIFWDDLLAGNQYLFDVIKAAGDVLVNYLEFEEQEKYEQASKVTIYGDFKVSLLQGPIKTLTDEYVAFEIKAHVVDFKIQHLSASNIASFYGGSGHENIGGFTKPLKEGLKLIISWVKEEWKN